MNHSPDPSPAFNPYRRYGLAALAAILLITFIQMLLFPTWDMVFAWLIAINLVGAYLFGFDQAISSTRTRRVPEVILLALTLLGGSIGAVLARLIFRHRTRATSFPPAFWLCVLGSILWIIVYYVALCPGCR